MTVSKDRRAQGRRTIASIKIEWNDPMVHHVKAPMLDMGNANNAIMKTRCQRCWGRAVGRINGDGVCTGIKCQVCERRIEGEGATTEKARISRESMLNFMNMSLGHLPKYRDGEFAQKVFLGVPRLSEKEVTCRADNSKAGAKSKGERKLTREDFPLGSAGLLFAQAKLLVSSTEPWFAVETKALPGYSGVRVREIKEDGTAVVSLPIDPQGISEDPGYYDHQIFQKFGSTMATAMVLAFSCELVMKAIGLTSKDEAIKCHNLMELYNDLPESIRNRLEADYGEIKEKLNHARHTFGKWRYFEKHVGGQAIQSMISTNVVKSLGKAARVLLDEAEYSGLDGSVSIKGYEKIHASNDVKWREGTVTAEIKGREEPLE